MPSDIQSPQVHYDFTYWTRSPSESSTGRILHFSSMSILSYNGSAVIGMAGEGCVAIASDLRFGVNLQTISTDFTKVHQLCPRIFVGLPGLMTDNQTVFQRLQFRKNVYELRENKSIRPKTVTTMLSNLLYERRFGPYFVEPVVVGLDHASGKPHVACMDLIGCISEADDFVVGGTCTEQLYGMCETLWEDKMKPPQLFECISQCILNAADRDCLSGWGARVYLIEPEKVTISDLKMRMD